MTRSSSLYPAVAFILALTSAPALAGPFIGPFTMVSTVASTVPSNGDVNPYGVAVVPDSSGSLVKGNVLVSNFNNNSNQQGTGTTIVQITPGGAVTQFAHISAGSLHGRCPGGVGLTTALAVMKAGFVIVGSLPTSDGTSATAQGGCLIVLDNSGNVVNTISGERINGPWDMTAADNGSSASLFVSNVLNGTVKAAGQVVTRGTVVRVDLDLSKPMERRDSSMGRMHATITTIGSGFPERNDPAALVIGPTGLGLASDGTLYVADTVANRIASIPDALSRHNSAGAGTTVSQAGGLNAPLGLAIAPNGDILTVNGGDGHIVETAPDGTQVAFATLDTTSAPPAPNGAGALFGLAVVPDGSGVYFVDDAANTLNLFH